MVPVRKGKAGWCLSCLRKVTFYWHSRHLRDHFSSPEFPPSNTNNAFKFLQTAWEREKGRKEWWRKRERHTNPQRSDKKFSLRYSAQIKSLAFPEHGHKRNPLNFPPGSPAWKRKVLEHWLLLLVRVTPTAVRKAPPSCHKQSRFQRARGLLWSPVPLSSSLISQSGSCSLTPVVNQQICKGVLLWPCCCACLQSFRCFVSQHFLHRRKCVTN